MPTVTCNSIFFIKHKISLGDPGLKKDHILQVPYCSKSVSIEHTPKEQYMIRPISAPPPPPPHVTQTFLTYTAMQNKVIILQR